MAFATKRKAPTMSPSLAAKMASREVKPAPEKLVEKPPEPPKPVARRPPASKPSEIKPLPVEFNPAQAMDSISQSVSRIAPSVANALATLEQKVDGVNNAKEIALLRSDIESVKTYVASLKGGYTMDIVRGDDGKITRIDVEPK